MSRNDEIRRQLSTGMQAGPHDMADMQITVRRITPPKPVPALDFRDFGGVTILCDQGANLAYFSSLDEFDSWLSAGGEL